MIFTGDALSPSRLGPAGIARHPAAGRGTINRYEVPRAHTPAEADGWQLVAHRGSHQQYEHRLTPGKVTLAGKPNADVPKGTAANILRRAGLRGPSR